MGGDSVQPSARLVGSTLGHFKVLAVLGEGGMGVVYRAFDERLRRNVALKVLPDDAVKNDERRRRFLREARSAAAITHANVATIHDVGEIDGRVYIAMELVEGPTLQSELSRARLSIAEALRIGRAIARALAKAHEKGIVHRDLKPENVMLNEDRDVKVLDFGLAKLLERGEPSSRSLLEIDDTATGTTVDGRVLGTPAYMSPEQAMGMQLDARSDVFSFGTVLYEMLSGLKPFVGESPMQLLVSVTRDTPPSITTLVPTLPAGLAELVDRCLAKERDKRYASGRELLGALEAIEASTRLVASTPTLDSAPRGALPIPSIDTVTKESMRPTKPPTRRARAIAFGALGAAIGALAVLGLTMSKPRGASDGAPAAASARAPAHVPEAASLMERVARREGEGRHDLACADAERASDLDDSFGEAHLTASLCHLGVPRAGRPYFRRAWAARESLRGADFAIADALEPVFQRDPEDDSEMVRRLADATSRFPNDARLHFVYARALRHTGDDATANVEMARSLALDGRQPFALELHADFLAYDGEIERALDATKDCLDLAPSAVGCLLERAWIQGERGECADVEATARRMLTIEPEDADAARVLANALYAQRHSIGTSRELLRRIQGAKASSEMDSDARVDAIHVAMLAGDFAEAERLAQAMRESAAKSVVATDHAIPDALLVALYRETKRDADASAIAAEYLDGRDAWEPEARFEDWAMANEPTPLMLAARLRAGAIARATYDAELAKTLKRWDARVERSARNFIWVYGWAAPAETPADGLAAKNAARDYAPLPPYKPLSLADEAMGRAFLLAGDVDGALPYFERAAASCFPLDHPMEHTRAELELGQAREAKGDKDGACAAYAVVVDRWGNAKPKSLTAEKAKSRRASLGCR